MRFAKAWKKVICSIQLVGAFIISWVFLFILLFHLLNRMYPLEVNVEYSTLIISSDGELIHAFLTSDDKWRMYTELEEITPELKKAIVYKEDKYFYSHPGVNPFSLIRAVILNLKENRRTSGASTISMQVVRLLEPKERNYKNKLIEIFRAIQLENMYTKDEILQLYLNLVPYGSNIEGVKSASEIYFEKSPNHLSIAEITALSIIPNRPVSLRLGSNNEYIVEQRNRWLKKFEEAGLFEKEYIADAMAEPLNAYRHEVPRNAPHLSLRLKTSYPGIHNIHCSLNMEFQQKAEELVGAYSRQYYFRNIKNATAIVIDNETRQVLAYVGSADFDNPEDAGQVDGIQAVRSPGSTLKPLLYGIAMDEGLITGNTILSDVPVSFAGYEPENYDDKFHGYVSVEEALANSLNVPAVKLMNEISPDLMLDKLIAAGFNQIRRDKDQLGLSLVLGGCGVSLEELTSLYCSFANRGEYQSPEYVLNASGYQKKQILSPGAAYMITDILTKLEPPDFPVARESSVHAVKIAWKTGTSYGRRDAWSIGYNNKYTIGVWVGNFSGEGVPDLSGATKATPLLFRLFTEFDRDPLQQWFKRPGIDDLQIRYVCSASGKIPGEYCSDLIEDDYIAGVSDNTECNHLKKLLINPDSTLSYCTACKPELGYIEAIYPNYEPEMISYFEDNTIPYQKIPPHNPKCERLLAGSSPKIVSPIHELEYYVNVLDSAGITLQCQTSNDVEEVYWYINKKFFTKAGAEGRILFLPNEGKVDISCSDDKGRNTDIWITVKYTSF